MRRRRRKSKSKSRSRMRTGLGNQERRRRIQVCWKRLCVGPEIACGAPGHDGNN